MNRCSEFVNGLPIRTGLHRRLTSVIRDFGIIRYAVYKVDCRSQSIKVAPRLPVLFTGFGELFYNSITDIDQSKYTSMVCDSEMPGGERVSGGIGGMGLMDDITFCRRYRH